MLDTLCHSLSFLAKTGYYYCSLTWCIVVSFFLSVIVTISKDFDSTKGIYLEIQSGCYDHFSTVLSPTSLCDLPLVNGTNACPRAGSYTLQTTYSVPHMRDYGLHYTPDLNLIFWDSTGMIRWGCATTGTRALHHAADRHAQQGWIALAISTALFSFVFASLLWWSYRRKKRLEHAASASKWTPSSSANTSTMGDDASMNTQSHHGPPSYHYFRTLPNGQVVPIPTATRHVPPPAPSPVIVDAALVPRSNPSYNEPHVLSSTRPII
jgi:hypothetical protein